MPSSCSFKASGYNITQLIFTRFDLGHFRKIAALGPVHPVRRRFHPNRRES